MVKGPSADAADRGRTPYGVLAVLFFGVLMAALDIAIVGPALPALRAHFGVDERSVAWVFNTFVLFNLIGLPFMARAGDVLGRRTVYLADVGLFAAGSLLVASAPAFGVLLAGRALQGLGASGIFPLASAVVGDVFAPEQRGRALGLLGAVFGVAFIIGPILAGILLLVGWRWLFLVNLPLAVGIVAAALWKLPSARPPSAQPLDARGIALLGTTLGALALGISRLDTAALVDSVMSIRVWPFLLLAAVTLPVFVASERRATAPLLRLDLFARRQVVLASALAAGAGLTEAAFIFFPALAVAAFGVTTSEASYMLLPLVFAVALGSPLLGRVLDRVGSRTVVVGCTALLTAGLLVMGVGAASRGAFYAGSVLIGVGLSGLLGSALAYILLNESSASERTVAQGVITLFISVGQLLGGALVGAVASSAGGGAAGYRSAFTAIAVVMLVLAVLSLGLKPRSAERTSADGAAVDPD